MSGFEALQQKLIQAKAVMNKVDGMPSKMNGTQQTMTESSNPNLPPVSNNFNTQSIDTVIDNNNKLTSPPKITEEKVKNSNLPDDMKPILVGLGDSILYLLGLKTPPPADDPVVDTPL